MPTRKAQAEAAVDTYNDQLNQVIDEELQLLASAVPQPGWKMFADKILSVTDMTDPPGTKLSYHDRRLIVESTTRVLQAMVQLLTDGEKFDTEFKYGSSNVPDADRKRG